MCKNVYLLGAATAFIPVKVDVYLENDILNFKKLKKGNNLVGYILVGNESAQ
ncbi:hypothetical protein [Psychroserpens burtonensis]|uniref:hypothetical protein n=1 Tax=Psychroserpens burtonensis TaxID=49278 RepID=UPI000413A86D|nr:hypothetical protein [Psychroserpens burtonensis]